MLWDLSGRLCRNYALIPVSPVSQCHLPYLASCCGYKRIRAQLSFSSNLILMCHISLPIWLHYFYFYFEILSAFMPLSIFLSLFFSGSTDLLPCHQWDKFSRPGFWSDQIVGHNRGESVCVCVCVCVKAQPFLGLTSTCRQNARCLIRQIWLARSFRMQRWYGSICVCSWRSEPVCVCVCVYIYIRGPYNYLHVYMPDVCAFINCSGNIWT